MLNPKYCGIACFIALASVVLVESSGTHPCSELRFCQPLQPDEVPAEAPVVGIAQPVAAARAFPD
jgi:hypothetical protein